MLDIEEMENLYNQVIEKIREKMFLLNRDDDPNSLIDYLKGIGMKDIFASNPIYETYKKGKIVIFGDSAVDKNVIYGIAKSLGIDINRLELHLEYEEAVTYNFNKLRYEPSYRVVLVGPMPHSTVGKQKHSSVIAEMEQEEGYPKVVRLVAGQELKITKTNLKEALQNLLKENYI